MSKAVVLIFDIGKTNKKILLFDRSLNIVHEEEVIFEEIPDDDGFSGDDAEKLENWVLEGCRKFLDDEAYDIKGINFTTYGATLMYLDKSGRRLTPVYNYLKPMPEGIVEAVYEGHGGEAEFCRKTASPALGMLNAGFQALWLKQSKPEVFQEVDTILHLPQYLSHMLSAEARSEHTSIGCHTAMWDFDNHCYHPWLEELGNTLPEPVSVSSTAPSTRFEKVVPVGVGIHDSSSSLAPYFLNVEKEFILVSTGTWCISMNPFNPEPLTAGQLKKDCLSYMSIQQKPVKSSRLFMGRIHDVNVKHLNTLYGAGASDYKAVKLDEALIRELKKKTGGQRVFFKNGVPEDQLDTSVSAADFSSFKEAYHQLVVDLVDLTVDSIQLIIPGEDHAELMFVSGGFAKNPIFLKLLASRFPGKKVYTSEVANSTSMGAAQVLWTGIDPEFKAEIDLGLKFIEGDAGLV